MKIAIASDENQVSGHFGGCQWFSIFEVEDSKIKEKSVVAPPPHQPGALPRFLKEQGVHCVVAGGMGHRAQSIFKANNIETFVGISGSVEDVIQLYLEGSLVSGESSCNHGSHDHHHHHHHGHHDHEGGCHRDKHAHGHHNHGGGCHHD
jgi:predicted Fe-Mo cluster-binding NifX family protein